MTIGPNPALDSIVDEPDGKDAWTRAYLQGDGHAQPVLEHQDGECDTCDTLRAWRLEADRMADAAQG